jgi:hypothetical protein
MSSGDVATTVSLHRLPTTRARPPLFPLCPLWPGVPFIACGADQRPPACCRRSRLPGPQSFAASCPGCTGASMRAVMMPGLTLCWRLSLAVARAFHVTKYRLCRRWSFAAALAWHHPDPITPRPVSDRASNEGIPRWPQRSHPRWSPTNPLGLTPMRVRAHLACTDAPTAR